jgi:hypothetical protein
MTHQLFRLPKQVLHASSLLQPGWKVSFFLTTTSTPTPVYTTSALSVAHTQPVVADAAGVLAPIYLDPAITYKATVTDTTDTLVYTVDPVNDVIMSQASIGALLYPRTAVEITDGVTPSDYAYPYGDPRRRGPSVIISAGDVAGWFDYGHTATRVNDTTITIPGDQRAIYRFSKDVRLIDDSGAKTFWRIQNNEYSTVTTLIMQSDSGNVPTTISSIAVSTLADTNTPPTFVWDLANDGQAPFFWNISNDAEAISRIALAVGETSGAGVAHGADTALAVVVTHSTRPTAYINNAPTGACVIIHTGEVVPIVFGVADDAKMILPAVTSAIQCFGSTEAMRFVSPRSDDLGGTYVTFYENDNSTRKGRVGFDDDGVSNRLIIAQEETAAPIVMTGGTKHSFTNPNKAFTFDVLDEYADDAAASAGGVEVGELYRTGSAVKQRVA